MNNNDSGNKHKGLGNESNVLKSVIGRLAIVSVMDRIRMLKKNAIVARCDNFRR